MSATNVALAVITPEDLLKRWQGHRGLTRRVIEAFPEKELFEFSLGGMRTFAGLALEVSGIATGIDGLAYGKWQPWEEIMAKEATIKTKAELLAFWDEITEKINREWPAMTVERFNVTENSWGFYQGPVISILNYFIDNEIHHRGQGYVYLRTLGIEPPAFYEH
ncbi:damage-inducible protein DinB [Chitinophaga silvatica]|uniref:Damage-inducible protein DinB n=1 Tax=Chitinophaga silvatica TaxID=2282649 RepID=A0A3E1YF41_9BACT|nr:DinB family protein [Chitinophaga silvatica]RFS25099.1 damage-inducible protein DinB [Chitinophaga silvatica]